MRQKSSRIKNLIINFIQAQTNRDQRYDRVCQLVSGGGLESYRSHLGRRNCEFGSNRSSLISPEIYLNGLVRAGLRYERQPPLVPLPDFDR